MTLWSYTWKLLMAMGLTAIAYTLTLDAVRYVWRRLSSKSVDTPIYYALVPPFTSFVCVLYCFTICSLMASPASKHLLFQWVWLAGLWPWTGTCVLMSMFPILLTDREDISFYLILIQITPVAILTTIALHL